MKSMACAISMTEACHVRSRTWLDATTSIPVCRSSSTRVRTGSSCPYRRDRSRRRRRGSLEPKQSDRARRLGMSRRRFLLSSMGAAAGLLVLDVCSKESGKATRSGTAVGFVHRPARGIVRRRRRAEHGRRDGGDPRRADPPPRLRARARGTRLLERLPVQELRRGRATRLLRRRPLDGGAVPPQRHRDGRAVRGADRRRRGPVVDRRDGAGPARRDAAVRRRARAAARPRRPERRSHRSRARRHARAARLASDRGVEGVHARARDRVGRSSTTPVRRSSRRSRRSRRREARASSPSTRDLAGGDPAASPVDIGPAAVAHPDLRFVVYHSGYESANTEGAFAENGRGRRPSRPLAARRGRPSPAATCMPSSGRHGAR